MKNLAINRMEFTDLFWNTIFSNGFSILREVENKIRDKNAYFESLRVNAEYNTGSVSLSTSICLALISSYFQPSIIAEVGTFIGRSTYSLALGGKLGGDNLKCIHSCDASNDISLNLSPLAPLVQYPKQTSNQMHTKLLLDKVIPELYFVDGRLTKDDAIMMEKMNASNSIIVLDDFEGTEKGVTNAFLLTESFKNFVVAYPPQPQLLQKLGLFDRSLLSILVPISRLSFVNQG